MMADLLVYLLIGLTASAIYDLGVRIYLQALGHHYRLARATQTLVKELRPGESVMLSKPFERGE